MRSANAVKGRSITQNPEGMNDPKGRFERTMVNINEDERDRFYRRNFEEMMGLGALAEAA